MKKLPTFMFMKTQGVQRFLLHRLFTGEYVYPEMLDEDRIKLLEAPPLTEVVQILNDRRSDVERTTDFS